MNGPLLRLSAWSVLLWIGSGPLAHAADVVIPRAPSIAASSHVLLDATTGTWLMEDNPDNRLPPASLTKIMTSYVIARELTAGRIGSEDLVPVSVRAWRAEGSRMFIREGTEVPVEALVQGIVIQSGNDASIAMAEYIGGSEDAFADMMNEQAQQIGLQDTRFANATGLPAQMHYSTARDMAKLARQLIHDYPQHYAVYQRKAYTWNDIVQSNRNRLLWRDRSVDGVKTGHTDEAGYCLVASAVRNSTRLISVVFGTKSDEARMRESQKMLAWGFRYYQTASFYVDPQKRALLEPKIWMADRSSVPVGLAGAIYLTIPRGHYENVAAELSVDEIIRGPLAYGDVVGELTLTLNGKALASRPVVVLDNVGGANFLVAIWHAIYLFFIALFT